MISIIIIWFLQDFAQVFLMGICVVPDLFLLCLIMMVLLPKTSKEKQIFLIWVAFFGGLFWDLRWTNIPGLTAAINSSFVALSCYSWNKIPSPGRTVIIFALIAFASLFLSGMMHLIFWSVSTQVAIRQFLVQQLMGIPIVVLFSFYFWKASDKHV